MKDLISLVEEYIEKNRLLSAGPLVVGVSGGADSMALLFVLKDICDRKYPDISLSCAHIHHGIRAEADHDEKVVSEFCLELGVPLHVAHIDIPKIAKEEGLSLETAGRLQRYAFFNEICGEKGTVAVAHHMEDQAESIAMHIFRGSGMEGLCGIRPKNGNVIHPFLCLHKEDILSFCKARNIKVCNDVTNDDTAYDRNFFRHEIFPKIEEGTGRDPVSALVGLSERVSEENDFLDSLAEKALEDLCGDEDLSIPQPALAEMPRALRRRVLRLLAIRTFGDVVDIESVHWEAVLELSEKTEGSASIDLPGERLAVREGGRISFRGTGAFAMEEGGYVKGTGIVVPQGQEYQEIALASLPIGEKVNFCQSFAPMRLRFLENEGDIVYNNLTWFFPSSVLSDAVIRTRRKGDTISRAGSSCTKELRRFMNEAHIPQRFRDRVLLIGRGNETLWLPGVAHAVGFTDAFSAEKYRAEKEKETNGREEALCVLEFFEETT
ncbi:MAG: tRNA lysidine(34) synthetase TilS [Clostridiales bacterium]|nr:tRNA lysidine(34) synthetase TilS [Clostridiales bacterium]